MDRKRFDWIEKEKRAEGNENSKQNVLQVKKKLTRRIQI